MNVKIKLEVDLKVSDDLKEKILNDDEALMEFVRNNIFRNNAKFLVSESIEELEQESPYTN